MPFSEVTAMKMQIKRSELYATKGKVTLLHPEWENPHTMYELNETLAAIITKKYEGDKNAQS
jgi:hypothetical protein